MKRVNLAQVWLWGNLIGAVSLEEGQRYTRFEYNPEFIKSGIELSPLVMPLNETIYSFPALSFDSFHGLPGLLSDSLPDKFGTAVLEKWLAAQGRDIQSISPIERLCYQGKRGMGALEYVPAMGLKSDRSQTVQVDELVRLANYVLSLREQVQGQFKTDDLKEEALLSILRVGSSAGGARAKAVIAWNPVTGEVRSGQLDSDKGFENWLIKFDGISNNKDKERLSDPAGYGLIEYAYYNMARACGITMSPCRLMKENGRNHFMTLRFDRGPNGEKIHMQSLAGLAHYDFNLAGRYSYEQAFSVLRRLNISFESSLELYRRMVFNVAARNQDDHVKNIAFLMDRKGTWSLAPAYDMTYNYQEVGEWTAVHQMTINGKRDSITADDLLACAKRVGIKNSQAKEIINRIVQIVGNWRNYADETGVSSSKRDKIFKNLRLNFN